MKCHQGAYNIPLIVVVTSTLHHKPNSAICPSLPHRCYSTCYFSSDKELHCIDDPSSAPLQHPSSRGPLTPKVYATLSVDTKQRAPLSPTLILLCHHRVTSTMSPSHRKAPLLSCRVTTPSQALAHRIHPSPAADTTTLARRSQCTSSPSSVHVRNSPGGFRSRQREGIGTAQEASDLVALALSGSPSLPPPCLNSTVCHSIAHRHHVLYYAGLLMSISLLISTGRGEAGSRQHQLPSRLGALAVVA